MQTTDQTTPPHSLSDWKVLFPYWKSEEKWWAWSLLGGTIGLSVLYVQSAVWFGAWYHRFFDAFFAGQVGHCLGMLPLYLLVTVGSVGVHVTQTYLTQVLSMRWRLWNTRVYLRQYLSQDAYYRLEHGPNRADNPDQRIADDLSQMTVQTLKLGLDAIDAVTTLLSFAVVLWNIGGVFSFDWHGHHFQIPCYLFVGAVITTLAASGILERFGSPLIGANYRQQHFDADLRAGLMDIRRNSEQIAFYGGENAEHLRLSGYLSHIATNWRSVVRYTWRVNFIGEVYTGIATVPLWLMLAPKAMAHALSFGLYSQINSAYTQVRISLEWFIFNYADLATLRSVLQRLGEFERVVSQPPQSGIERFVSETPAVQIRNLVLNLPDNTPITRIGTLTLESGERWLVRGPSGSGKSTFLRALAGLWRHGSGDVSFDIRQAMFLPQRSYVPSGTLRQALSYPATPDRYDALACQQALEAVNLAGYGHRMDDLADWGAVLSPGEQQRLAVARALLFRPAILFLDEATSALDEANERRLYEALLSALPGTTFISVAHHEALRTFHDHEIVLGRENAVFSLLEK